MLPSAVVPGLDLKPVLQPSGQRLDHLGRSGSGQVGIAGKAGEK
jgi:hypothetical protein